MKRERAKRIKDKVEELSKPIIKHDYNSNSNEASNSKIPKREKTKEERLREKEERKKEREERERFREERLILEYEEMQKVNTK